MATSAIDSKKLLSRKYQAWRVLQAPGAWAQLYIDRSKRLAGSSSAILFPEQILGLDQDRIYIAHGHDSGGHVVVEINPIYGPGLWYPGGVGRSTRIKTVEEVYDIEFNNSDVSDLGVFEISLNGVNRKFNDVLAFSSRRGAIKWCHKFLEARLD